MLEIVSDSSCLYTLKETNEKYKLFPNFECFPMNLLLSCGNISNLLDIEYRQVLEYNIDIKNRLSKLTETLKNHDCIRIWTSRKDAEDYLIFLFVLYFLKKKNCEIRVVFADDYINEKYQEAPWSISCCDASEITEIIKQEKIITAEEKIEFIKEWEKNVKENKPVRIINDGRIKSIDWDYFDNDILATLKELGETKMSTLTVSLMSKYHEKNGTIGDILYSKRIKDLITDNKIEIVQRAGPKTLENDGYVSDGLYESIIKLKN